ncbi:hypothetical protein C8Q76DRAFT_236275 [Earliella scabrosa]|nr:hypothetical protein C8Q76DRAFT_236275 [Earliella scabrosa]
MALWGYNRPIMIYAGVFCAELISFGIYAIYNALYWITASGGTVTLTIDALIEADRDTWPAYACLAFGETGIVAATLLKYLWDIDVNRSSITPCGPLPLTRTMYRDGLLFYAVALVMSITNLLVMLLAPMELAPLMQMPLRLVHSTLCGRVLLNLRKAAARSATDIGSDQLGIRHWQASLAFVSPVDELCEPEGIIDSDSTVDSDEWSSCHSTVKGGTSRPSMY